MTAPRLEIRLDRLQHNARTLAERLGARGITVTGVTKATLGAPEVASALLDGGIVELGESRVESIERLRAAGCRAPIMLIRSPMASQASRVVAHADVSLNSELMVIERLSAAAEEQGRRHGVVLMVELGDLREGIPPADLAAVARRTRELPGIDLVGIGANLACQSGVAPDDRNMAELSALATAVEVDSGTALRVVSGGNSANLDWALGISDRGRVNNLRLGESILLGREPLRRRPIAGLRTDAFSLVAEVIESQTKPTRAWGEIHETAFGRQALGLDRGTTGRVILALGRQDVDPDGLAAPDGLQILGASSDHLVLDAGAHPLGVGTEVRFRPNYSALMRAMTSPFVAQVYLDGGDQD